MAQPLLATMGVVRPPFAFYLFPFFYYYYFGFFFLKMKGIIGRSIDKWHVTNFPLTASKRVALIQQIGSLMYLSVTTVGLSRNWLLVIS
jgi:hypothetical protein